MGLRFRKSIKIAPGIKVNLSSRGAGLSFGGKGCRYSIGASGRRTTTFSIPGTGIYYSTSSGNSKKRKKKAAGTSIKTYERQIAAQNKAIEQQNNAQLVNNYYSYMNAIKTVHTSCGQDIDWKNLSTLPEPFKHGDAGPNEKNAVEQLKLFKPTLIEKIFGNSSKRKSQLEADILTARKQDDDWYSTWEDSIKFANRVLTGDIDAYYEVIEECNPFEKLVNWGCGFEFGTDNSKYMEVEFTVKSKDVVPIISKTLTKTGKISEKELTKTSYYDYTQDYVCSCSIRIARELFSILPIDTVIVHATDSILNTATGNDDEQTILSVIFERKGFQNIDFNRIDASDFVQTFNHNMKFKKTSGFYPVERLSFIEH